jgi:hypothetical protein
MLITGALPHKLKSMKSNRFKTDEARERHTKASFEAILAYDNSRIENIKNEYGLHCIRLSEYTIRVTDGNKRLDLYKTRYFKVDTGERGNLTYVGRDNLIREYFNL